MLFELLVFFILLFCAFYIYLTWNYGYWEKRGIPCLKPVIGFGNLSDNFLMRKSVCEVYQDIYNAFDGYSYIGFYKSRDPAIMIRDPELVKTICVKEFASFHDNDFQVDESVDPMLGKNPFVLPGNKWKIVRQQVTTAFTNGKVKNIFELITEVCDNLIKYLEEHPETSQDEGFDMKEVAYKYTIDVIASCAFGLQGNSFTDPQSPFREMGRRIAEPTFWTSFQHLGIIFLPAIAKLLRFRFIPKDVAEWFQNVIDRTVTYREKNNISRNDFLELLIQLKHKPGPYDFTNEHVAAHAVTFFSDGFEQSSTVLSYALYEMARNLQLQERLRNEVDEVLDKYNGKITYDAIQEMTYLDAVVSECMRKYPPLPFMNRLCTAPYTLPPPKGEGTGPNLIVEPGTTVNIPIFAIQRDPKYYPNPEVFDPDRFTEEAKAERNKYTYLAFGEGPRICLGIRLAMAQSKAGIAAVISKFEVRKCTKTKEPKLAPGVLFLIPMDGIWLKLYKRK